MIITTNGNHSKTLESPLQGMKSGDTSGVKGQLMSSSNGRRTRTVQVPEVVIEQVPLEQQSPWARLARHRKQHRSQKRRTSPSISVKGTKMKMTQISDNEEQKDMPQKSAPIRLTPKQYKRLLAKAMKYSKRASNGTRQNQKAYVVAVLEEVTPGPVLPAPSLPSSEAVAPTTITEARLEEFSRRLSDEMMRGSLLEQDHFSLEVMMEAINHGFEGEAVFHESEARAALARMHEESYVMISEDIIYRL